MANPTNNLPEPEAVLMRLWRCMTDSEQCELIPLALGLLAKRKAANSGHIADPAGGGTDETDESEILEAQIMAEWPGHWPGRQVVDLDNLGDPSAWLLNHFGEPVLQMLFGWAWDDDASAEMIAEEYLRTIREDGYPVTSDFVNDSEPNGGGWTESDEAEVTADFVGFFREWREQVLKSFERHATKASRE